MAKRRVIGYVIAPRDPSQSDFVRGGAPLLEVGGGGGGVSFSAARRRSAARRGSLTVPSPSCVLVLAVASLPIWGTCPSSFHVYFS